VKIKINQQELATTESLTLLQAAQRLHIQIPTLCYKEGYDCFTSCMICVVKDKSSGRTLPACSAPAEDGMDIETENEEISASRKATLELLLSDHVGDCEAPCQRVCPAHMEIPAMIRSVTSHHLEKAIAIVRRDLPLPSILERFCTAPCEKGCRRTKADEGLSIRHLIRYVADWDLKRDHPFIPPVNPAAGKTIAIIGAGMTGLSAAYFLGLNGFSSTVFEKSSQIGGRILTELSEGPLPGWIVEGELKILRAVGVTLALNQKIESSTDFNRLRDRFDAVIVAMGNTQIEQVAALGLPTTPQGPAVHPLTMMSPTPGVFLAGSLLKSGQPLVKTVATAKTLAVCVQQFLENKPVAGPPDHYHHTMGRLLQGEIETFRNHAAPIKRIKPENLETDGLTGSEAELEGSRCMHCDCREKDHCKLRIYSTAYGARQNTFAGSERAAFKEINQDAEVIFEPGKCVKCGLCVRVTKKEGEHLGFSFIGRGFDLKTGVSLNKSLQEGMTLEDVANKVTEACPTGALCLKEEP